MPSSNSLPSAPVPQLREKPELIHPEVRARRGAAPSAARCRRHPGCMHLRSKRSLASPPASASDASNANAAALKRKRSELTDGSGSSLLRQLLNRQTDSAARASFPKRCFSQRFTNLKRRVTMDLYGLSHPPPGLNQMLHQRHRITELTVAEGIVLGLTENGVCVAYCMRTGRQLCVLNSSVAEVVRSLFHNKLNGTLITVSVYAADQFSCLRCRATALSHIREGVTTLATPLFTSESLRWPGFVEFDDVNGKVLTYSADQSVYKAWSLADPSKVLYSFSQSSVPPSGIEEVKISPGIMLLVCKYTQDDTSIPLRVLSVETGEVLRELRQPIRPGKKVDIIEQFNERLMLKQEGLPLHIIDLLTNRVVKVKHAFFRTPSAFIFLYENHSFLAFRENSITNWNFKGEMLHTFQDHALCFPIPDIDHTSVIYITQVRACIVCHNASSQQRRSRAHSRDSLSGHTACAPEFRASHPFLPDACRCTDAPLPSLA